MTIYLTLQGQKSGLIKGPLTTKGHEGQIPVRTVGHSVADPLDPASGRPTSRNPLHQPLTVTKTVDCASPLLYKMLVNIETITQLDLDFWLPPDRSTTGTEVSAYRIRLTNALLVRLDLRPDTVDEQLSLSYQSIAWTWVDGGITADTTWTVPVV